MRHRPRLDTNQPQLVKELRQLGYSVQSLASLGKGAPDLLIGKDGVNWLFELKDPSKPPSKRALTEDEQAWHAAWRGQVAVAENLNDVLKVVEVHHD